MVGVVDFCCGIYWFFLKVLKGRVFCKNYFSFVMVVVIFESDLDGLGNL